MALVVAGLSKNTMLKGCVKEVEVICGASVWSKLVDPVDCAIAVLSRTRLIGVKLLVALDPTTPDTKTKTLLVAVAGVMLTVTSVTSTNVVDVVLKVSVLIALTTCKMPVLAAKLKLALSDAAVSTSPAVYVVNGMESA